MDLLVNVLVITYNHELYIEKAIRSILKQETNFKFNIIVGEDKSTDSTRDILLKLYKEFPDSLVLLLHEKNIGSKQNLRKVEEYCEAPYIAILEGDDYWTDSKKLQTQIDFLIKNPKYSGCVHGIKVVDSEDNELRKTYHEKIYWSNHVYTKNELIRGILPGQSGTMVYRNILFLLNNEKRELYFRTKANGDWRRTVLLLSEGPIFCFSEKMSNYRFVTVGGSSWNAQTYGQNLAIENYSSFSELEKLSKHLISDIEKFDIAKQNVGMSALKFFIKSPNKTNLSIFFYVFRLSN